MASPQATTSTADPNARVGSTLLEKPDDFKTAGVTVLPKDVVIGTGNGQYYGYKVTYADGRTEIEWYKRGEGTAGAQDDPVAMRTPGPVATDIKEKWDKERKAEEAAAGKKEVRKYPGTDPATNLPAIVTEYSDGSKTYDSSTTATTTTPASKRTAREEAEIAANAALPADQDPRSETNAERATRADARIKQQGADALAAEARERQRKIDEQNAATAAATSRRADSAEARAIAEANKVGAKVEDLTINGLHYTKITKTSPDGKTTSIEQYGPDGKAVDTLPREGVSTYPADLPQFTYNWDDPAGEGGISAWAASVRARPDLTDKVKAEIITSQYGATNAMLARARDTIQTQENTRTNATTQRGQDMSQANVRLGAASADFGTSAKAAADATKYSEGPEAASVLPYYMAMARAAGQGYGGFQNSPQVGSGPAIQQAGQMGIPGLAGRLPPTLGAPAGFTPGAPPTLGSPEGQGLLANNEATRQAVMAEQRASAMANPIFRPPPPIGADPMAGSAPPARDDWRLGGQPSSSGQLSAMLPTPGGQPQQQPYQPSGAGAMLMQRAAGGYDPTSVNQLLMQAGVDPDIINMLGGVG